jgi:hypothetical protein
MLILPARTLCPFVAGAFQVSLGSAACIPFADLSVPSDPKLDAAADFTVLPVKQAVLVPKNGLP